MTKEKTSVSSLDIQNAYLKFYPFMMQYLWDINTVMNLARLEIAIYKRFPDKEEMEEYIRLLENDIKDTYKDTEILSNKDFKQKFEALKDSIEQYDECGLEVYAVQEKLNLEEIKGESEEAHDEENIFEEGPSSISEATPEEPTKKKIKIGKIVRK